jgi:phenylacetate-CoA ligase
MKQLVRLLENLRVWGFYMMDFLKGRKIKKHLWDIKMILDTKNEEESKKLCETYLKNLLNHAIATTPFYKNINNQSGLEAFPVINKNTINANPDDFKSYPFRKKKTKRVSTSGSTGAPLQVVQDKNKQYRNQADTLFFSELAGFKIGHRLYYIRHWVADFKKSRLISWFQNIKPVEVLHLSNPTNMTAFIEQLKKDPSRKGLLGYAGSGLGAIANHLEDLQAEPMELGIKSIIGMSENLSDQTRQQLAYYFKAPVVSRYSNMENGILAQQKLEGSQEFMINWASYYIEILQLNSDQPVKPHESGRIVVTDLFNRAMPLIRYDTGDLGSIDFTVIPPVLHDILGRQSDVIYNTLGQPVASLIIINMTAFKGIKQLQLIQENKNTYTLKISVSREFKQEKGLLSKFKLCLGQDAQIKIESVTDIPVLSSGKQKITVNNYSKN